MTDSRMYYVIDTNILIDYPDLVPPLDGSLVELDSPTIDLTGAHLVIPSVVIRELSNFKKEKSERGRVARMVLKRIRDLTQKAKKEQAWGSYLSSYNLRANIEIKERKQLLSILPVAKNFVANTDLPFAPASNDMDGQIILTALAVADNLANEPGGLLDGESGLEQVTILTNDNGLAIRANIRGLATSGYGYKYPEPYTGRREVTVPKDMLSLFMAIGELDLDEWQKNMPGQPRLIANEFIIMHPDEPFKGYDPHDDPYFSNIGRYDVKRQMIVRLKHIREFPVAPRNPGQAIYAEALAEPSIAAIVCTGPAGSGKTFMATVYSYEACKRGEYIEATVVPCEDRGNTGALPGDLDEKMDPSIRALKDALRDYLMDTDKTIRKELSSMDKSKQGRDDYCAQDSFRQCEKPEKGSVKNKLDERVQNIWENWFSSLPVDKARGRTFSRAIAIYDEFQDQNATQADTLVKRIGKKGKMIITGDVAQVHVPWLDETSNGLVYASRLLEDDYEVAQVHFTEEEVVRHSLVRRIAERQATQRHLSQG